MRSTSATSCFIAWLAAVDALVSVRSTSAASCFMASRTVDAAPVGCVPTSAASCFIAALTADEACSARWTSSASCGAHRWRRSRPCSVRAAPPRHPAGARRWPRWKPCSARAALPRLPAASAPLTVDDAPVSIRSTSSGMLLDRAADRGRHARERALDLLGILLHPPARLGRGRHQRAFDVGEVLLQSRADLGRHRADRALQFLGVDAHLGRDVLRRARASRVRRRRYPA